MIQLNPKKEIFTNGTWEKYSIKITSWGNYIYRNAQKMG